MLTKEQAEKHLNAWYEADLAVSTGQSYKIGSRQLTRTNIAEIRNQIRYWEARVEELSQGKKRVGRRISGIIPRDL